MGNSRETWQPQIVGDTSIPSYWLNWRVLVCSLWVVLSMLFASFLISKKEGNKNSSEKNEGILYQDEVWRPCLKGIHPVWLLGFRVCAFLVLLSLLIINVIVDGASIFYYYTQWTFTLVTIYFGLGSLLSIYGCYEHHKRVSGDRVVNVEMDEERVVNPSLVNVEPSNATKIGLNSNQLDHLPPIAGFWSYVFQVIFQMNAGAVMLTDCVFWFIIVPFLASKNYDLNFYIINMHTVNLLFLLGDTALNSLRFPWFRIAYFILWTSFFVIFQWVLHACISIWWPYPFLDLSSSFAPLWYSSVAAMHIPCYSIFFFIMKLKHIFFSKYFPQSYNSK